jgi:hypothetical protein
MANRLFRTGAKVGKRKRRWAFKIPVRTDPRPKKKM